MGEGEKIRHEILNYLSKKGRVRSHQIHPDIMKICKVSETPVYRELRNLDESGQIKRDVISLAEVWYEAKNLEQNISLFIDFLESELLQFDKLLKDWRDRAHNDTHVKYTEHQIRLRPLLNILQNINAYCNLVSNTESLKQSKKFKDIKKEIEKRYLKIITTLPVLKNERGLMDILATLHMEMQSKFLTQYDNYIHPKIVHEPK